MKLLKGIKGCQAEIETHCLEKDTDTPVQAQSAPWVFEIDHLQPEVNDEDS